MQEKQEIQTGSPDICEIHGKEKVFIGSGYYIEDCPDCWKIKREKQMLEDAISRAKMFFTVPVRFKDCCFANYNPPNDKAKKALMSFVNYEFDHSLILIGGVGTGKTHLAVALCLAAVEFGRMTILTTLSEIIREVKSSWKNKATDEFGRQMTEQEVIDKYSTVNFLVIDEIGSQYGSDSERIVISEIINNRYNSTRPTVIIGNITLSQAQEYLGERVIDRLKDGGEVIVFDWESYRKPMA